MRKRSSKNPRDVNQLAKAIVDEATSEPTAEPPTEPTSLPMTPDGKNAAAVILGQLGGRKGGKARAAKLTDEQRTEIARKAARARWSKEKK